MHENQEDLARHDSQEVGILQKICTEALNEVVQHKFQGDRTAAGTALNEVCIGTIFKAD